MGTEQATERPAQAPAQADAPRREAVAEIAAEWGLAGTGIMVTDPFEMPAGKTEFDFTFDAAGPFHVRLVRLDGTPIAVLAEGNGPASVTRKLVDLDSAGSYTLHIRAAGDWTVSVLHASTGGVARPR